MNSENFESTLGREASESHYERLSLDGDGGAGAHLDHKKTDSDKYMPSCSGHLTSQEDALKALICALLNAITEWSRHYGYSSISPLIILRQALALIEAEEELYRD